MVYQNCARFQIPFLSTPVQEQQPNSLISSKEQSLLIQEEEEEVCTLSFGEGSLNQNTQSSTSREFLLNFLSISKKWDQMRAVINLKRLNK